MSSEKVFFISFLVSLTIHGVILLQNPHLNLFSLDLKQKKIEVSYLKNPEESKPTLKKISAKKERQEFLKLPTKITLDKRLPPQFTQERENIFKANKEIISQEEQMQKPTLIRPDIIAIKKKIILPPVEMNKISNSSYISYYQIVREKIRRAAYQNYYHTQVGEVYLTFLISNDGHLREVKLVEEKSSPNSYLRDIALKSIKDASPFPNFPKELDYLQLSFNVIISFEIE